MPAALDFNLGSHNGNGTGQALTTNHASTAGTRVVVFVSFFGTGAVTGITDNAGHTYAITDKVQTNGSDRMVVASCPISGGLASGVVITPAFAATPGGVLIGALSLSGVDMSVGAGAIDNSGGATTTGTNWSSGTGSAVAGGIAIGAAGFEAAASTTGCTASVGTLVHGNAAADYDAADGQGFLTAYLVVAAGAAGAVSGAIGTTSTATTEALVIYKAAGSVATVSFNPPRMPLGV